MTICHHTALRIKEATITISKGTTETGEGCKKVLKINGVFANRALLSANLYMIKT